MARGPAALEALDCLQTASGMKVPSATCCLGVPGQTPQSSSRPAVQRQVDFLVAAIQRQGQQVLFNHIPASTSLVCPWCKHRGVTCMHGRPCQMPKCNLKDRRSFARCRWWSRAQIAAATAKSARVRCTHQRSCKVAWTPHRASVISFMAAARSCVSPSPGLADCSGRTLCHRAGYTGSRRCPVCLVGGAQASKGCW